MIAAVVHEYKQIKKQPSTNNFDSKGGYCRLANIYRHKVWIEEKKYCTCIDLQSAYQAIKFVFFVNREVHIFQRQGKICAEKQNWWKETKNWIHIIKTHLHGEFTSILKTISISMKNQVH